jgi:uncharacterized membrane protein
MRWLSFGVLAAAAGLLGLSWDSIPARWVTHWGAADTPNGWTEKTPLGVFGFVLLGIGLWVFFEGVVWLTRRTSKANAEYAEVVIRFLRMVGVGVSLAMAAMAIVLPLAQPRSSLVPVAAVFIAVFGSIGLGLLRARKSTRALASKGLMPEGYDGLLYRNPNDSRLWVPKLVGVGWTLNFAHRQAWALLIGILLLPLAVTVAIAIAVSVR